MAKKIDFQVGFNVNKNDLNEVQKLLNNIINLAKTNENKGIFSKDISKAADEADRLQVLLNKAWNNKLGQLDLNKLNNGIKSTYGSVDQLRVKLESVGRGDVFNKLQSSVLNTNLQLKQSNKLLNEMATSMANTVKWGITSNIFNNVTNQIQKAYDYSIKLDTSLNDIRIVSSKSADDMERFAVQANKAAKALGSSTLDYTKASTIYYQQGLSDEEVASRTNVTLKAANVTGQTGSEVSEQLTAIWNGYKVSAQESELYIDKVAKVAASTAADLEEMATGMGKVASAANAMGVDFDNLNAMLATVISVTREAPETIGTSFRSIFSRLAQLEADGTDEFGVSLTQVTQQMDEMGIKILDQNNELRDMDDILEDVAGKWNNWSKAQQVAAARTIAGSQQYSRFIALMDNQKMWQQALVDSKNAAGELQTEQDIYMESTAAHLQKLSTEAEKTYNILFDKELVDGFSDALTGALSIFNNFIETTGGGLSGLVTLGGMLGNIFNKQIGSGIGQLVQNKMIGKQNEQNAQVVSEWASGQTAKEGLSSEQIAIYEEMKNYSNEILSISKDLTSEQYNSLNAIREQTEQEKLKLVELEAQNEKSRSMTEIDADITNQSKLIKEQEKSYARVKKEIDNINNIRRVGIKYTEDHNDILQSQREILDSVINLNEEGLLSNEQQVILQKTLDRDSKDRILTKKQINDLDTIEKDVLSQQLEKEKELTREKELQKMIDNGDLDIQRIKTQQLENELKGNLELETRKIAIQETVKGMTALVSLTTTFVGIVKTLNDDSLTGWEKFEKVGSSLLMTLPLLITNFSSIKKLLPNLAVSIGAVTAGAKIGFGQATIAVLTFETALGPLWLVLLGVAAAIAAVVAVGITLYNEYNRDANAAKMASEAAKELTDNYNKLKESAEELKSTLSEYNEAKKELEDLKIGTDEYGEALEETNKKAKELIETLGLYDKYTIKNGIIEIDTNALEDAQMNVKQRTNKAEEQMYLSKIVNNNALLKSQRTDLSRNIQSKVYENRHGINDKKLEDAKKITGDSIQEIISSLNKLKDADEVRYQQILNHSNQLSEYIKNTEDISDDTKNLAEYIGEENVELEQLIIKTNESAKANEYYAKMMNEASIEKQFGQQISEMSKKNGVVDQARYNQIKDLINQSKSQQKVISQKSDFQEKLDQYFNELNSSWGGLASQSNEFLRNRDKESSEIIKKLGGNLDLIGGEIKNEEDLTRKYAIYIKNLDKSIVDKAVYEKGKLKDDEGNILVDSSSGKLRGQERESLIRYALTTQQNETIEKSFQSGTQTYIDTLYQAQENAAVLGAKYGTDFSQALLNAISDESKQFDLSSLYNRLDPSEVTELKSLSSEQIAQMFGLTESNLTKLGFDSLKQFGEGFKAGLKGYQWDIDSSIAASLEKKSADLEAAGEGLSKKKLEEYEKDVEIYAKNLMQIADSTEEVANGLKYDSDTAVDFALKVIKMNKAINTLADNMEDWSDIIKKSSKTSQEYAESMYGIRDAIADVYDTSMDYISNDFITKHLEEIQKIASGDEQAIEGLRNALSEEIIGNIILKNEIENKESVLSDFVSLREQIQDSMNGISIGEGIDDTALVESLNKMIEDCEMTVEQANAVFSAMGVEPTYETETVSQEQSNPIIQTDTQTTETEPKEMEYIGPDGEKHRVTVPNFTQVQTSRTIGYSKDTVEVPVTAIAMNGKQPKISGVKKAPGGSFNNYSSKNTGGSSPGKTSKGSGGGGGSSKSPSKEKKTESKQDPYHDVNIQLKNVSTELDRLSKQQSKFFGQSLVNNLSKQYELLGKQIELDTKKISIARQEQEKFANLLSEKGVSFNTDGTIANYADAYNAQLNYLNSIIDQYNSMSAEAQESFKETLDNAKEDFNTFVENINEYDKIVTDTIPEIENDIQDAIDKQIEINITKFNMEIEIRLDMAQAEKDWNAFKKKVIDEIKDSDILGNAKASLQDFFSYYKEGGEGIIQTNTKHIEDILTELKQMDETGTSNVYGDNRTKALEDLKNYNDQLMKDLESMVDLTDEIKKSYLDMMDEASDKFKEQLNIYSQISDLVKHDMNVIQLIYGEDSYSKLASYYSKQEENYNNQLNFQRQQVDFWKQQMDALEEGSDEWKKAKEEWMDAVSEWNNLVETSIENIKDKYLNTIKEIFQELNNNITSGLGLDYTKEQWDLINKNADQYLDTINSMYAVQKLQKKYQDAIDTTDNISQQRKLNQLMNEEIAALQEQDKLSQYDIDRAELKYQIALKQIALQEAQQNKSTMRLRRDSQGNYSYQYGADNDQISSIQQEISDLYNQLYNMDVNKYRDNLGEIYDVWEEFQEKMAEAAQINDPEARAEKELLLKEQYGELINQLTEQNENIRTNIYESGFLELSDLYQTDYDSFASLAEDEKNLLIGDMIPQWESGMQQMAEAFGGESGFYGVCEGAFDKLELATKDYEESLKELQNSASQDFSEIANGIDESIYQTQDLLWNNQELIMSYQNELNAIQSVINELNSLIAQYKAAETAAKAATAAAYGYWQAQQQSAAKAAEKASGGSNSSSSTNNTNTQSANGAGASGSGSGGSGTGDGVASIGDKATLSGSYYYDSFGASPTGSLYSGVTNGVVIDMVNNNPYGVHIHSADGKYGDLGWVKKSQLTGYDTGGYTGNWGDNSGRLALLHKKELVLNSEDTENMLNILNVVRNITQSIDSTIFSRIAGMIGKNGFNNITSGNDTLEQNVHIEANFPNVTKSTEIENAINNLCNIASQRINKNRG